MEANVNSPIQTKQPAISEYIVRATLMIFGGAIVTLAIGSQLLPNGLTSVLDWRMAAYVCFALMFGGAFSFLIFWNAFRPNAFKEHIERGMVPVTLYGEYSLVNHLSDFNTRKAAKDILWLPYLRVTDRIHYVDSTGSVARFNGEFSGLRFRIELDDVLKSAYMIKDGAMEGSFEFYVNGEGQTMARPRIKTDLIMHAANATARRERLGMNPLPFGIAIDAVSSLKPIERFVQTVDFMDDHLVSVVKLGGLVAHVHVDYERNDDMVTVSFPPAVDIELNRKTPAIIMKMIHEADLRECVLDLAEERQFTVHG